MQKASDNMAIPSNPVIGAKYRFSTLYVNGVAQVNPTRPWRSDQTPPGMSEGGNIPADNPLTYYPIIIGSSDADLGKQIQWVYVGVINGHPTYISDRDILHRMNRRSPVGDSTVTVDGMPCNVRMITGGSHARLNVTNGIGGTDPVTNEWDLYIGNEAGISGLLTPSATDNSNIGSDAERINGAHN